MSTQEATSPAAAVPTKSTAREAILERFDPAAPAHTVKAFRVVAQDDVLDRELTLIESRLFASNQTDAVAAWSSRRSLHRIASARRRLLRRRAARPPALMAPLNPPDPTAITQIKRRAIAR